MENSLVTKLKNILDNTTQEQFDKEWNSILELGLNGHTIKDFMDLIDYSNYQLDNYSEFMNEINIDLNINLATAA